LSSTSAFESASRNDRNRPDGSSGYVALISCVAAVGGFLFGFDSGVINGTVTGLQSAFGSTSAGTGFNVASMLLGCAFGALLAGRLADRFGRRGLLRVAALFFFVSAWGSGWADTSVVFVTFRVLGGLAVGAASVLAPAYISEVAPAHRRGALSSVQQIAIITGLFLAFVSNYVLAGTAGSSVAPLWFGFAAWRWMFWIEMIPSVLFGVALCFIPESPRFLVLRRDRAAAAAVLERLLGAERAESKCDEIEASLAEDHHIPRWGDLLVSGSGRLRPIVGVGIGLAILQQFVGINVVFYYGAVLWQSVGFSESDALLTNVLNGGVSIIACAIAMATIDRVGRKRLLAIGSAGMAVALGVLTVAFAVAQVDADGGLALGSVSGPVALVAANVYVFFFNLSWGPVMWVMLGEMFPNQIRGAALSISGLAQWLANFLITVSFPILLVSLGLAAVYGFYAACAVLSIFFVHGWVQETRGRELEEMRG
jgi:SP family sugar:H+ symporter-like MFS transporter